MWCEGASDVLDLFKNGFPVSLLFFIPIFIIISPVTEVYASHEFSAYRMQHYDLQGTASGSRNVYVNSEARTVNAQSYARRCVLVRLKDFSSETIRNIREQHASGLLILLPGNIGELNQEELKHLMDVEALLLEQEQSVPIYFSREDADVSSIYSSVEGATNTDDAASAAEALLFSVSANGFQLQVNDQNAASMPTFKLTNLHGKLPGAGVEEQLPTIVIVAHYDAFGIAPSLSFGADSNGSGVAALLELARLFSRLYSNRRTHAGHNLLFFLSGGGKFNYIGTKRWLDEQVDNSEHSLPQDISYVLCLDSLGLGDGIHLHVSKPPKKESALHHFHDLLSKEAAKHSVEYNMTHKKINLAEELLAWEHERFSIKRLSAATVSRHVKPRARVRRSISDARVDARVLARNVKVVAEALAQYVFNTSADNDEKAEVFTGSMSVSPNLLGAWMTQLTAQPRAAQLMTPDAALVNTLQHGLSRHLREVKKTTVMPDKTDPEFMFYGIAETKIVAYRVKPAIFDLYLSLGIAAYLGLLYLIIQNFDFVTRLVRRINPPSSPKMANGYHKVKAS